MSRLVRSNNKVVAGVCAGVAEHFGWNISAVRCIWLLLTFVGVGSPLLFYVILCLLMPSAAKSCESYEERMKKRLGK